MNASWVRKAGVLSLVVLGWALAGCGSVTSPVAPVAQITDGLQPPGPQGESAPPSVPGTPQLPPAGVPERGIEPGRISGS
jgi:hypothetical protein